MKVGFDTIGCNPKSGIGSYLINFISHLPQETEDTFELFGLEEDRYDYTLENAIPFNSINIHSTAKHIRLWHKYSFNKFVKKSNYDVVIFPKAELYLPSKFSGFTGVAILNTILSQALKNTTIKKARKIKKGFHKVQKIVAATQFIKDDLIKCGVAESKIIVIPNGINHKMFYPAGELIDDIVDIKPFAIKRPYFVYGSSLSTPEKKHIELIKAFSLFKKNTGLPHRLVIAGNEGPYSEEIHKAAYDSDFASDIFLTGFFPHESFPKLYAGADACVFPSVSEGSGLPVLEAFASGVPVICSDKGALKEISGNAAVHFDSDSVEQIASMMNEIIENKTLREEKISEGLKWAANFTWEKTVELTIKYIKE